jgi:hypothetical protein
MPQEVPPIERAREAGSLPGEYRSKEEVSGPLEPLITKENEHRLAEAKAQAEFDREEKRKANDYQRQQHSRAQIVEWCRDGLLTVFVVILLVVSLYYANPWTMPANTPPDVRQFAATVWTSIVSGSIGYVFGSKRERSSN